MLVNKSLGVRNLIMWSQKMSSPKIILTDLDGVIRHWSSDAIHEKEIEGGFEPGFLYAICFEENLLLQVVTGKILDEDWRIRVQTQLAKSAHASFAKEMVALWTNAEVQIDKTIIEIYRDHFPRTKVILATNATSRLNQDLKKHGLENLFDGILNSSELGVAKPAHSFYNQALSIFGVGSDEVIYVDDSIKNVQSAQKLGIRSHCYQNHAQLVEFLAETQRIY
jgi:putative hydrolase of the HAD superfamily